MNRIKYILYIYVLVLCVACDSQIGQEGIGWLHIGRPTNDMVQDTRNAEADEIDYLVSIYDGEQLVMNPTRYSAISGSIPLSAGDNYSILAQSCTPTEAEATPTIYGQPRYAGTRGFQISPNQNTKVRVDCTMANAAFQVQEDASFYYTSYTVTATLNQRVLTFTNDDIIGYFNLTADQPATLQYEVVATDSEGNTGRGSGTIMLKARNLSKLVLRANSLGSISVSVTYDDTFTPVVHNVILSE